MVFKCLLLLQLLWLMWPTVWSFSSKEDPPIALPNCQDRCGDVMIRYPFGIGANCYHDASYEIFCNTSFHPPKPFLLNYSNLEVINITWPGDIGWEGSHTLTVSIPSTNICPSVHSVDFGGSPYRFSGSYNVFRVENCGHSVVLKNRSGDIVAGCASVCATNASDVDITNCYGVGCCQASLPVVSRAGYISKKDLDFYQIAVEDQTSLSSNTCTSAAALIEEASLENVAGRMSHLSKFSVVLEWRATYLPATAWKWNYDNFSCSFYSQEYPICQCEFGYAGNPYLPYGCRVVQECEKCRRNCDYNSTFDGGGYYYCNKHHLSKRALVLGFSIGMGLVLLVLICYWLYRLVKWRKEIKRKAKHFKRNGGLLLQQQMSSSNGVVERAKIFTTIELEKATDNFNENRILGQGGQGTVYKGILMDGKIAAIKKSKKVDESQLEQFINEVVILSQINHRNVVKLIGCCLETEVPLLVYEFIPNGTLFQHIHDPDEDFHVTWNIRLQIAAESAGALAYLHSASSAPIYHRDIKSSNILLDDKYRAKVSDFGTARAISIEQTHVTTCVLGTYGYLDPEYFQSNQFTEKSDVYSFGVVLAELLTGKKPICGTRSSGGWITLATEFLSKMENSQLLDILDTQIIEEGKQEELFAVADLARQCMNMNGKHRPTMKEIVTKLNRMRSIHMPISKELNHGETKCDFMEISDMQNGPLNSTTFFSDECSTAYFSIEVQPLMSESANT